MARTNFSLGSFVSYQLAYKGQCRHSGHDGSHQSTIATVAFLLGGNTGIVSTM